jgi:hypothetical protein
MNGGFISYGFLLLTMTIMVFTLGIHQDINATTTLQLSNINDNHNFFPFSLPFSSNLAEDSVNEQTYVNIIPFP